MTALTVLAEAAGGGAGTMLVGILTGKAAFRNRPPKPLRQFCSCGHGRGMHDEQGCHYHETKKFLIEDHTTYTTDGDGYKMPKVKGEKYEVRDVPCRCKKYDGPVPADEIILNYGRTL